MCIPDGSLDLYTGTCPMCVLFKHSSRCPHKRDTCRNRAAHPRHDVSYITNAEVQTFNGCGFCKWAKQLPAPPASKAGMSNPGWPGCCRPPAPVELALIPPADWPAVHTIHHTPIPQEVKVILDAVRIPYVQLNSTINTAASASSTAVNANANTSPTSVTNTATSSVSTAAPSSVTTAASLTLGPGGITSVAPGPASAVAALAQRERKSLVRANTSPGAGTLPRSGAVPVAIAVTAPQKARERGASSPQSRPTSLNGSGARAASLERVKRPVGAVSSADKPLKRIEGFRTTPPSAMRKLAETDVHDRPAIAAAKKDGENTPLRRRSSNASTPLRPIANSAVNGAAAMRLAAKYGTPEKTFETRSRSSSKSQTVSHRDSGERTREALDLDKIVAALSISGDKEKHGRVQLQTQVASLSSANKLVNPTASGKGHVSPDKARSEVGDANSVNIKPGSSAASKAVSVSGSGVPGIATAEKPSKVSNVTSAVNSQTLSVDNSANIARAASTRSDARSVSSGSGSGSTITSDGGFTDYLSDESEAELQRQAVERAALLEQNRMEEAEFRQARQQLAHVDLRPPNAWTTGVGRKAINAGYSRG